MDNVWLHRAILLMLVGAAWFAFEHLGGVLKTKVRAGRIGA